MKVDRIRYPDGGVLIDFGADEIEILAELLKGADQRLEPHDFAGDPERFIRMQLMQRDIRETLSMLARDFDVLIKDLDKVDQDIINEKRGGNK